MSKVIAFEYDPASTGAEHPVEFGVVPGVWKPGVPVLPEAFGLSVAQMRQAIEEFNLPIKEVRVEEGKAVAVPDRGELHIGSEDHALMPHAAPDNRVVITDAGPIPASGGRLPDSIAAADPEPEPEAEVTFATEAEETHVG